MSDLFSILLLISLIAIVLSLLVYQLVTGVPPMAASSGEAADVVSLLQEAGLPDRPIIYELGCGWGTLVLALARAFPQARIRGIELSPLPYWVARWRTRDFCNVELQRTNFYKLDLHDADGITCYLMMKPMPKVAELLDRTLKSGTPVVSLAFWFRGRKVAAKRKRQRRGMPGEAALYYWPAKAGD